MMFVFMMLLALHVRLGSASEITTSPNFAATRPNFVYVLMDDFWLVGGDSGALPQTTALLGEAGASFSNFFVSSPKCTPSRSSWLSGRYYHNLRPNGATSGPGLNTTAFSDSAALFPLLHAAGYATGVFGKIHNNQVHWLCKGPSPLTAPFTHIEAECLPCGGYYDNDWSIKQDDNDTAHTFTLPEASYGRAYSEAEYGNRSIAWIRKMATSGSGRPFFAYVGTTGPHLNAVPAPWHRAATAALTVRAPRTPNFNQLASDHNPLLAAAPELDEAAISAVDQLYRNRWGTLFSIDDLIAGLVHALEDVHLLDSSYVLASSDHGYHLGQFRIPDEKMLPYETDVRVPLWIRGPGIAPQTTLPQLAANIDVAPTLLSLAGLPVPGIMDGKSLTPLLLTASSGGGGGSGGAGGGGGSMPNQVATGWRTSFIVEFAEGATQMWGTNGLWRGNYTLTDDMACGVSCGSNCRAHPPLTPAAGGPQYIYDAPSNNWRMLRVINTTRDIAFIEWDQSFTFTSTSIAFREYFDLKADPWQQTNAWLELDAPTQAALQNEIEQLYQCRGGVGQPSNCR